jgi:hypothetical protein
MAETDRSFSVGGIPLRFQNTLHEKREPKARASEFVMLPTIDPCPLHGNTIDLNCPLCCHRLEIRMRQIELERFDKWLRRIERNPILSVLSVIAFVLIVGIVVNLSVAFLRHLLP